MAQQPIPQLKNNASTIISCAGKSCGEKMIEMYKGASAAAKGTCIVTTSKPASQLLASFQKQDINSSTFLFIDCVDSKHEGTSKCSCIHLGTSESLTNLSLALKKVITTKKFDLIVIDNISSLLLYNKDVAVSKFLHDIISSLRDTKVQFLAVILKKDMKGPLQELELFADEVMEV